MIAEFLKTYLKLNDEKLLSELESIFEIKTFLKGEKLICVGDEQQEIFLLVKGIIRGFLTDTEGREFTDCFEFQPGAPAVGCTSLELPAQLNIQALSSVTVLKISVKALEKLMEKYPEIVQIYNRYLMRSLEEHFEHGMVKNTMSAGERYSWFVQKYPHLLAKVPHKYIASFLNMTPQTLSKVRSKQKKMPVQTDSGALSSREKQH